MNLREIFQKGGTGVIGTSNTQGEINMAIYAVPVIIDEETIAFGMTEGTTYKNLLENPHASYLYISSGKGYEGARLKLLISNLEDSGAMLEGKKLGLKAKLGEAVADALKYVAYFKVLEVRSLI
ncbi:MAG: pyridoxamine 5'-phosphate oxidase family protein [Deltaproteobacteria bacterium]|nr:pyridoxamine 5'-phosphate oxidase family protein [Deltaproteobacteria bacterium]NIS78631.1 pyridoxamine 5'-phosphate oxidase family protein [Deltaproteobacteria bacterium]